MRQLYILLLILLEACTNPANNIINDSNSIAQNSASENEEKVKINYSEEGYFTDGLYCAEVKYYNPNTEKESQYYLTVELGDNYIIMINFPNGHLDGDEFDFQEVNDEGYAEIITYDDKEFYISIIGESEECEQHFNEIKQCLGKNNNGQRCKRKVGNGGNYCPVHKTG